MAVEETKLSRTNEFRIVGTLKDAQINLGTRKDNGQEYVDVNAVIVSVVNGVSNEYEVRLTSSKLTKEGNESKLFTTYSTLNTLLNKKVSVSGEIIENRYWSKNLNRIVSSQQLRGRFISGTANDTADTATWTLSGFVAKTLVEKQNKAGQVYRYDLTLGQSNYKGDNISLFTLHVNPNDREIISGVESYEVGSTVELNGDLNFVVEQVTSTEKSAFGQGVTKTYTNRMRNFYIAGGSDPIDDESTYDRATIQNLVAAYNARDVELQNGGGGSSKVADEVAEVETTAPVTKRQASLI